MKNDSTGFSPFYLDSFRHPRSPASITQESILSPEAFDFIDPCIKAVSILQSIPDRQILNPDIAPSSEDEDTVSRVRFQVNENIRSSQDKQAFYYDKKHTDLKFKVGDLVFLSTKNITASQVGISNFVDKLFPKFLGPFPVTKIIHDSTYQLLLPDCMKIHNSFHVNLLKPYIPSTSVQDQPSYFIYLARFADGSSFAESIVDIRHDSSTSRSMLIKWYGFTIPTWVPESLVPDLPRLLMKFFP